jgi:hypothetical protein
LPNLDQELKKKEGGVPSPGYDPDESSRIQTLLDRDRPGVRLLVDTKKVQEIWDVLEELRHRGGI